MTDVASWADRFMHELPVEIAERRAEVIWRTMAPNGLDLLIGEAVSDFGGVRSMLSLTTPDEWRKAADLIAIILEREPIRGGARYSGERIVLGSFAAELRSYADMADRTRGT